MARAKTEIVKRVSNLGTQAFTKTPIGHEATFVIRLKSGKYSSIDKPRDKCVLYNGDQQLSVSKAYTRLSHGSMVIGLQYKYTAKRIRNKVQKVREIVHYFPE